MKTAYIVFFGLLFVADYAFAEGGCPDGLYPTGGGNGGWTSCAPIPGYDSGSAGQPNAPPAEVWAEQWGAIAVDGGAGRFGGTDNNPSKRKAQKAAIKECQKNGGVKCKVMVSYRNQCGALAWGDNFFATYRGPNRDETIQDAVTACGKLTTQCQPYQAGCSYPVRTR